MHFLLGTGGSCGVMSTTTAPGYWTSQRQGCGGPKHAKNTTVGDTPGGYTQKPMNTGSKHDPNTSFQTPEKLEQSLKLLDICPWERPRLYPGDSVGALGQLMLTTVCGTRPNLTDCQRSAGQQHEHITSDKKLTPPAETAHREL